MISKLEQTISECENLLFTLGEHYDYNVDPNGDSQESPWGGVGSQIDALEVGIRYLKMMRDQQLESNN